MSIHWAILLKIGSAGYCATSAIFCLAQRWAFLPAAFIYATANTLHVAWKIPILIVASSGSVFCVLGILTRGSFLG